ncbi:ABC-2 type transport system permease protein [Arcanobacterium pluranimalium]|uniref:ABC transporter permease subunit n=1 Tax=Arcanobacterium pluranimalium TaxID=108028 RepID=UPI00195C40BF|nr:ABC transporter permease subunit [Arcanobacterium pluranimalium]MBM7824809.1 ABC-2 type transport system permease protein [Arcanobacterium pluranimalium]
MTSTAQITRTTAHPVNLLRSVNSEFYKLWSAKLTKITSLLVIALSCAPVIAIVRLANIPLDSKVIFGTWGLSAIFFLVIAVAAVSAEYSHNTMRTTVLSDPRRTRAFFAKFLAVVAYSLLLAIVLAAALMTCTLLSKTPISFSTQDIGPICAFLGLCVGVAVMGLGFGYFLRSTAGGITAGVIVLQFLGLLTLIPLDFFQKTLVYYLPGNLAQYAMNGSLMMPGATETSVPYNQAGALGIFVLYSLVVLLTGLVRFAKSDV